MLKFEKNKPVNIDLDAIYVVETGEKLSEKIIPQPRNLIICAKNYRECVIEFIGKPFTVLYFGDSLSAMFCEEWRIETQGAGMFYEAISNRDWQTGNIIHGGGARWYFSGDVEKFQDDLCLMVCFGVQPERPEYC
jgi:hypothetical protein